MTTFDSEIDTAAPDTAPDTAAPVAHTHEVENPVPGGEGYTPDPTTQAFVTHIGLTLAHGNDVPPSEVVLAVTRALEAMGVRGIVSGISAVELHGSGALVGL